MATWILPVLVGRTHEGVDVVKAIGTFTSEDEALQWGVKLVRQRKILDFRSPTEQMTLRQYDAWKAGLRAEILIPGLNVSDEDDDQKK